MNHKLLEVESRLFNRNIIQLGSETNAGEYKNNEQKLIEDKSPYYIQHQLDAGDLTGIHAFALLKRDETLYYSCSGQVQHVAFHSAPTHNSYSPGIVK